MASAGVDIALRVKGAGQAKAETAQVGREVKRLGGDLRQSGESGRRAGRGYEFATNRLHLFGRAAVGIRERTVGLAGAMLGITGAAFAVEHVVRDSVEAWGEQRRTMAQTGAVLKSTGGAANVTAGQITRLSESISRQTGLQGDQIQQASNMLLTFRDIRNESGKNNDIFTQSTRAAVDMSAAFQSAGKSMSISDAALQLGKALNDPAKGMTRLQRIGVTFTKGQVDQVKALQASGNRLGAQRIILRELTKEFGGSAAAVATPGAKLHATIHQLEEQFGRGLQPAIDAVDHKLLHLAGRAMPAVSRFSDDLSRAFNAKGLDLGQRLTLIGHDAKVDLGPLAHQIHQQLTALHIGDKLEQAVEFALPKMADAAAHAAPKAAAAFVHAWWHADIWGRLLTTAWLVSKIGPARFARAGRLMGVGFGTAFEESAAPRIAATEAAAAAGAPVTGARGAVAAEAAAAGQGGRLGRLGRLGRKLGPLGALAGPEGLILSMFGPDIFHAGESLGHALGAPTQEDMARAQHAANLRRFKAAGKVHIRYANGADAFETPQGAAMEVHLHHATYLDGRVIAKSVTKHAVDAKARKGG